jgi:hypothetical protein
MSTDVTDEQVGAFMPHAVHLAVAVAHGDPDATGTALGNAGLDLPATHPALSLILCLADLVTDAAGAHLRMVVRSSGSTAEAVTMLRSEDTTVR